MRVPYSQIFQVNPNGSVTPRMQVQIGGVTMGPGVAFGGGVSFGGVDLAAMKGKDIEVEQQGNVIVIKGFYEY